MRHRITVDEITAAGVTYRVDETLPALRDVLSEALEYEGGHRCVADLTLQRKDRRIHIDGRVTGELVQACARCTGVVAAELDRTVRAVLVLDPVGGEETEELDLPDLDESYLDGDVVDMLELVREQVLLALPPKPLCRDDCRGLCPRCGVDLNHETCSCTDDTADPRLAALADFKPDES